jgi:uncharacterized protein YjbJ (UPF0337 family)
LAFLSVHFSRGKNHENTHGIPARVAGEGCNWLHPALGFGSTGLGTLRYFSAQGLHLGIIWRSFMNTDEIKGKFKELKGNFKQKWGELTDDDWMQISGSSEKLLGVLQQKYGRTKEQAHREIDDFFRENPERKVS